jgi:hypothetical protein
MMSKLMALMALAAPVAMTKKGEKTIVDTDYKKMKKKNKEQYEKDLKKAEKIKALEALKKKLGK